MQVSNLGHDLRQRIESLSMRGGLPLPFQRDCIGHLHDLPLRDLLPFAVLAGQLQCTEDDRLGRVEVQGERRVMWENARARGDER